PGRPTGAPGGLSAMPGGRGVAPGGLSAVPAEPPRLVPAPAPGVLWTDADADAWLTARDLVGWRFALDRMERLLVELGAPQSSVPAIHVVGTNGKSSTTRMVAALLQAHGRRPGAYLSPHLHDLRERIELAGRPITAQQHALAVAAVARAAERVDRPGDPVTQFEAHTATAFVALTAAAADVFVIEAGLGGRLDATNVLGAPVVALTSVDLDHTQLLGDTIEAITAEKVAVVTEGATLVLGADLSEAATIVARDHCARIGAQVVTAKPEPLDRKLGAPYQQRNFALARAVCEAYIGALDLRIVREVAAAFAMPARFETIGERPTTILDGAHNPAGARALAASLAQAGHEGGGVAVMSVFADKDAAAMAAELGSVVDGFVLCDCGSPRALPPQQLAIIIRNELPGAAVTVVDAPLDAVAAARTAAGPDGFVVICGTLALAHAVRTPEVDR
ncbi:MAG: Mur ligase family protein, partial [Solirubrobacteraceae bacterium]|nr:Mur ligase family protein [Solirubrobacteraceae bacterium]